MQMKPLNLIRLAVYAAGVWICQQYAAEYWVVGPVFGVVVAFWDSSRPSGFVSAKHLFFIASSTGIYALVCWIARLDWETSSEILEGIIGSMPAGVAAGSLLLPLAHRVILGGSRRIWIAPFLLIASFYFVTLMASVARYYDVDGQIDFLAISILAWQGIYLLLFFSKRAAPVSR